MNKKIIFCLIFGIFLVLTISNINVSTDVISVNPGGSETLVTNPDKYIEGFLFGENTAPNITNVILNSSTGNNLTSDNLTCYAMLLDSDADNTNVTVRWYKNDSLNLELNYTENYANGTAFDSTLLFGNTSKGETWICGLRNYDGTEYSSWVNSSSLTIENTAPTIELISPADENSTTNRTPEFSWNGTDVDGNSLTYTLNLTVAGGACVCFDNKETINAGSNESYVLQNYLKCLNDNGCSYNWTVRAYDGFLYSEWATPWKIYVNASLAISLINNTISFGNISMGGSENTTLNDPFPFSLQNDGNCFLNISMNSTSLWETQENDSEYFKYKIDNLTGEEGAFNWLDSEVNWAQVPVVPTNSQMVLVNLTWNDDTDSAEVDILVTVPSEEGSGDRESTVNFGASLGE